MSPQREKRGVPSSGERHELSGRRAREGTPSRAVSEETREQLRDLQNELGDLQEALLLSSVQEEMDEIGTTLSLLPTEIETVRTRGYVFRSFLERKVAVLADQWDEASRQVSREIVRRTRELQREADEAENALDQAMGGGTVPLSRAQAAVEALASKVDGARSAVSGMYDTLKQNVDQTTSQIEEITWLLEQLEQASFRLHPAEDPVAACKAQFLETKKDGPKGVLYLTDERLIFEQKEKKATKKVLFIATEKETVQDVILSVPIGQIERTEVSQKGFLGRKEIIELLFAPEADLSSARLRLRGADNEAWAGLIGRVQSGEIAKERTRPKKEAALEEVRNVPTKCSTCGAAIDIEVVRGMRQITCEYCGTVIRI